MTAPLGLRNNNPGNIEWGAYARSQGAPGPGEGGRFAEFATMREGVSATARLLILYDENHQIDTIRGIVNRWAPGNENNVDAYIDHLCDVTECKADDHLDLKDPNTLFWLCLGIFEHENGKAAVSAAVSDEDIDAGVSMAIAKDHAHTQ